MVTTLLIAIMNRVPILKKQWKCPCKAVCVKGAINEVFRLTRKDVLNVEESRI